jgi:hypothetical protein
MTIKGLDVKFSTLYARARQILPGETTRLAGLGAPTVAGRP